MPSSIFRHLVNIVHVSLMCTLAVYIVHYSPASNRANIGTRRLYSRTVDLHHSNKLEKTGITDRKKKTILTNSVVLQLLLTVTSYFQDVIFIVSTTRLQNTFNLVQVLLGIASFLIYCGYLQGKAKTTGSQTFFFSFLFFFFQGLRELVSRA